MKIYFNVVLLMIFFAMQSCSQTDKSIQSQVIEKSTEVKPKPQHEYGGWYCPDNLKGFPAVDQDRWYDVPVINGRMPTLEEAQDQHALIFVDPEKYPDAAPLDMTLPQVARYQCPYSHREEIVIIIQAFATQGDSIVGFRFPNGGNGSAYFSEVTLLEKDDLKSINHGKFVAQSIHIDASVEQVWKVVTDESFTDKLSAATPLKPTDWRKQTNFNYHYDGNSSMKTSSFADEHFGLSYIQNDYLGNGFTEKVILFPSKDRKSINMELVIGPFYEDYEVEKQRLMTWVEQVKQLSEAL